MEIVVPKTEPRGVGKGNGPKYFCKSHVSLYKFEKLYFYYEFNFKKLLSYYLLAPPSLRMW